MTGTGNATFGRF